MRCLIERIQRNGHEWRVIARSDGKIEVWSKYSIAEFGDRNSAFQYVATQFHAAEDFQKRRVGEKVTLRTAGGNKNLIIIAQSAKATTLVDDEGNQFEMPHTAEALVTIGFCNRCNETIQGTANYTMEDHYLDVHGISMTASTPYMTPNKRTDFGGRREDYKAQEFDTHAPPSIGDVKPKKHYLSKRDINAAYVSADFIYELADQAGIDIRQFNVNEVLMGYMEEQEHDKGQFDVVESPVDLLKITLSHLQEDPRYYTKLRQVARQADTVRTPYYCRVDHTRLQPYSDGPKRVCPDCGSVYSASSVLSFKDIVAQPMPGAGGDPNQPPMDAEQITVPEKNLGQSPVGNGRVLTRHELIDEAETLIRNALWETGHPIGTYELTQYMSDQYGNSPEEIMQAIEQAYEKIHFEDSDTNGPNVGQGGPQDMQPPPQQPGAGPGPAL